MGVSLDTVLGDFVGEDIDNFFDVSIVLDTLAKLLPTVLVMFMMGLIFSATDTWKIFVY